MPESSTTASNVVWDIIRYVFVAVATGVLVWYCCFYTPTVYVSREHTGKTMETDYIVKVVRLPEQTDWKKVADEIQSKLDALEKQIDSEKLFARLEPPTLKKTVSELAIDFSAIVKGCAVDCIAELLEEKKIHDYMIEIDGRERYRGKKNKDKNWIAGIEKPMREDSNEFLGLQQKLALCDQSLATFRSVSVVAPNCTSADAWANVLFTLGEQKGIELANEHGISVLFLLRNGDEIIEVPSEHWQRH